MHHDKYGNKALLRPQCERISACGEGKKLRLVLSALCALFAASALLMSCGKKTATFTPDERKAADSIVRTVHGIDSLALLQKQLEKRGDKLGGIVALREWGKALRNESRFDEALRAHSKGLQQAEAIGDTLEWVQALNNIGTDYRRMGVLDVAQEYHYGAWKLSEECADTSFTAKKNRVVSLNGLGNIYLALGNYERADSALRMALAGEQQLHSAVGQAINCANLGAIFEHRGQTDSAWVYYRKSMALNTEADNKLGISLCHTYFGSLHEKARQYDKAMAEYETAYRMLEASKDEWHSLNSLIALAGINHITGNNAKTMEYLGKAKQMAERIKSPEHQAEVHTLYYKHYKQRGDCHAALASYEQATAMQDSILDMEKVNRIQNTMLSIERNRQTRLMGEAKLRLEQERTTKKVSYIGFSIVVISLLGLVALLLYVQRIRKRNHLTLKRLSAMREDFFTNITHEFRTPLTVILGLSRDLSKDGGDATDVREKALTIERQGNSLLTLINQLLDISKVKSTVGNANWRNGNITAYFTMIAESYRDYARSRNIDLQFIAKDAVVMDFVPDYANKIANNLLSNAFKFTPEYGKVSVTVWREGDRLLVDVADTGKGMDKETLARVFEPFYQAESDVQNVGTGVGLALVKQIIDAVAGTIAVESTVGKGTTFHIVVPIRNEIKQKVGDDGVGDNAPMLPQTATAPHDTQEGGDNACRLLVIEDNSDVAAYIGAQFAQRYAVSYATNGKEGLEKALELVPDLIITDLMMPEMDGLEVCRQVRDNEIVNHIPIIVVTAKITEEERIKGLEAGADAYLAKPFNVDELRTRVEKLLDRHRHLQEKFAQAGEAHKEEEQQLSDVERRFIAKTVDLIYLLLDKRKLDVNTMAEKLCMSPRQFHRKIVALTGDSPATYLQKIKMQKACRLLESNHELTIEEIADHCGFEHVSSFYHAFKKTHGVTPAEYRKSETSV